MTIANETTQQTASNAAVATTTESTTKPAGSVKVKPAQKKQSKSVKTSKAVASKKSTKTSPSAKPSTKKSTKHVQPETAFQSEEFRARMSALVKERGGFKRTSAKEFKARSDSAKVNCVGKRFYHKFKLDGKPDAWKRAVAAARKELGIPAAK